MKSYQEMMQIKTFEKRIEYLMTNSQVGIDTFGGGRYLNQMLYKSPEWKRVRDTVILRDEGRDLAFPGHEIPDGIIVHHINPVTKEQVLNRSAEVFDLNNLVCVSLRTHNIIHYGSDKNIEEITLVERTPNDTIPWR